MERSRDMPSSLHRMLQSVSEGVVLTGLRREKRSACANVAVQRQELSEEEAQIVEEILKNLKPQTKLVFLDHITSCTALLLPVKKIITKLNHMGIDSFIDGAHAPGMVPLNLDDFRAISW